METRKVTKQIPHACPVCKGKGEVGKDLAQHEAQEKYEGLHIYACHVCGGSCLIWEIREEDEPVQPDITQIQFPPTILNPNIPNLPNIGLPQSYPPYGVTWTSATNRPPELGKFQGYNASPAWNFKEQMVTDHICGSMQLTPQFCKYCFEQRRYNGAGCSCSPEGMPHSQECKGYFAGPAYENLKNG